MNELLAATAVQGTQSVPAMGSALAGVTGYWYGKSPGVDQALDGIRHGNQMGTHPDGGVVAFVGDDATAKSSTVPGGSEPLLRAALLPMFTPADPHDVAALGLHAVALSRASGLWTAVKIATVYRHQVVTQVAAASSLRMEKNLHEVRLPIALAYSAANRLNRITRSGPDDRIGIVAEGKTYLEVRQALSDLGLDDAELARLGIRLLKIAMPWPLEPSGIRDFAAGLDEIVVVEDKGPFLEHLVKDVLFNLASHPRVLGSGDAGGKPLFQSFGELDADIIARGLGPWILARGDVASVRKRLQQLTVPAPLTLTPTKRTPYFCSGCPHSRSTRVPDSSLSAAGIGCHTMVILMDETYSGSVTGLTQMGGEGAQWIGQEPYVRATHLFQNMGDGTLAHSGLLAIRGAVAAGSHITYKILYNSAVAMTGGQDAQGGYTVPQLVRTLAAEGVTKIIVTTPNPKAYRGADLPPMVIVRPREDLLVAQEELRDTDGVTVLIHDQECAAELRRKRKRGKAPDPPMRPFINERLCEGCGDCGRVSNCLSVTPVETEFGRKTQIHQPSCNSDYSCLGGDCPSFLEVTPSSKRRASEGRRAPDLHAGQLSRPTPVVRDDVFTMRITGIGGTGVVTIAQVVATAGFIDGYAPRGLDQVGLSQKAGPVVSDLKLTADNRELSSKVSRAECDLYLVCDVLVAAETDNLAVADASRTVAVVSTADVASGAMVRRPESAFPDQTPITAAIDARTRTEHNTYLDAKALAQALFGGDQFANMLLVGAAYQAGALPLSESALERAIELNGVAVADNLQAFRRGRQAVADPAALALTIDALRPQPPAQAPLSAEATAIIESVGAKPGPLADALLVRVPDLIGYQDAGYARRYAGTIAAVHAAESTAVPGSTVLATAVAVNLHKLMAYKDEYETARLALDPSERARIKDEFGDGARVVWKLHPPILRAMGLKRKLSLGRWFKVVFILLRWAKWTRGTKLDVFGYAKMRRTERGLVTEYLDVVEQLTAGLAPDNHGPALRIAALPDLVRGYEHIKLASVEAYRAKLVELRADLTPAG
jgi:indolepyruvate ferredoxin oxidoreductase